MELKIYNPTMDNALKHIDWNFEELKKEVTEKANVYKSLVYTDENIKEAKADRAALNKFSKALNDGKKDVKKMMLEPYSVFEGQVKELIAIVDEANANIDSQVKAYDQKKREEKLIKVEEIYDRTFASAEELKEILTFKRVFKESYLNVTTTLKSITNDMEHQYLDASLGASVVGTHSLSSVLLIPQESGAGLNVETHNINYCTISMYRNALLTAGVEDAKVIVAAPSPMSGTAALVGAVKAYETYSGTTVSDSVLETAADELVLTGQLSEDLDSEKISDLIAYLKQQIAENHLDDPDKLADLVRQAAEEMGITLTDEQVSQIVDLLLKLSKLDIDPDKLAKQAKELYNKLESLGITVDKEKVGNFITNFVSSIWELIQSFLNQ